MVVATKEREGLDLSSIVLVSRPLHRALAKLMMASAQLPYMLSQILIVRMLALSKYP